ncbi:MAG: hypothetical protein ACP5P4_16210 [Steroidobacteraceae bacterium]
MQRSRLWSYALAAAAGTIATVLTCSPVQAAQQALHLTVDLGGYAKAQVAQAHQGIPHLLFANTVAGQMAQSAQSAQQFEMQGGGAGNSSGDWQDNDQHTRYPGQLQYHGGHTVQSATEYMIYVDTTTNGSCNSVASCWGDPDGFLTDLGRSRMIHITDQYVHAYDGDRYTVYPKDIMVTLNGVTPGTALSDFQMQEIVYEVTTTFGLPTGFNAIYDIFLPPGQDECQVAGTCYSPDNASTFKYCAYHNASLFPNSTLALYTVEPYQDVSGCSVRPNTGNGQLVDSTDSVLSHETFETITDPNTVGNPPGYWPTGWWNELANGLFGQEIGDECSFLAIDPPPPAVPGPTTTVYFDPSEVNLAGHTYWIQPEYNNAAHACTTYPSRGDGDGNGGGNNGWGNG